MRKPKDFDLVTEQFFDTAPELRDYLIRNAPDGFIEDVVRPLIPKVRERKIEEYFYRKASDKVGAEAKLNVPLGELIHFRGAHGENRSWNVKSSGTTYFGNIPLDRFEKLLESMALEGVKENLKLRTFRFSAPNIREGNHRVRAGLLLKMDTMPCEIEFMGNSAKDPNNEWIRNKIQTVKEL